MKTLLDSRLVRAVVGIAVVSMLVWVIVGYWNEFRGSGGAETGSERPSAAESTSSPDPAARPEGEGEAPDEDAEPSEVRVVLIDGLNLRTQPSRSSRAIRGLEKGERLTRIGATEGWYEVRTAQGETGWVSSNESYTSRQ